MKCHWRKVKEQIIMAQSDDGELVCVCFCVRVRVCVYLLVVSSNQTTSRQTSWPLLPSSQPAASSAHQHSQLSLLADRDRDKDR